MEPRPSGTRKNLLPFLTGAVLCYVLCLIYGGRIFTAGAAWNLGVAAAGALCFWPLAAVLHLGFQVLLSCLLGLIWKPPKVVQLVVLNAPITALILWTGITARQEPARAFAHFLATPVPQSVRIKEFGRSQGIGEPMRLGLAFEIQEADLLAILKSGGYAPSPFSTNKDLVAVEILRVSGGSGVKFEGGPAYQCYTSTNHPERHLLCRANDPLVFFFAKPPR